MQSIDKIMAMGGNYLLNVGPKGDGTIPDAQQEVLRTIGAWFRRVKESYYDAQPASELTENQDILLTRKGNTLYVHLYKDPESSAAHLKPLDVQPRSATLLNTGQPLETRVDLTPRSWLEQWNAGLRGEPGKEFLRIRGLPVDQITDEVLVLKLEFDRIPNLQVQAVEHPLPSDV